MTCKPLTALDRSFLTAETRDVMMHVGMLLTLSPPKKGRGDLSKQLREDLTTRTMNVQRPWNLKLKHPDVLSMLTQAWVDDEGFEIDYHVRRSALPSPGDERELGILVSRLHSTPLDFHRPPWEAHFIEGLEGDRIAIYFKVHHSLIDGYTGMRMLTAGLSKDATENDTPWFFERPPVDKERRHSDTPPTFDTLVQAARDQFGVTKDVGRALMDLVRAVRKPETELIAPMQAPKSILNQKITRSRRFATQLMSLERVKKVAATHNATVNDVVLAISGSALRRYLLERDALPDKSLVAMLPVNIRPKDDPGGGGNAVGAVLASLATDYSDDEERLVRIVASTKKAKEQLQTMSKNAILQYSMLVMTPLMLSLVPAAVSKVRPAFNVVISNVPGPEMPLYLRGWKLEATYPLSIPFHGYGLNITVQSYAGTLGFGFIGCRDTVPHLQRLAVYSGEVLDTLES